MNRILLFVLFLTPFALKSQTIDYETPETSQDFQIFGGNLEGTVVTSVPNPDASGVNTSATVLEARKSSDAPDWGGMFSNPNRAVDASNGGTICMDVWSDHATTFRIKIEMAAFDDPTNYEMDATTTTPSQWETICYDLGANSLGGDMTPATGKSFVNFVIFPDFGTPGDGTETVYYIDNITLPEGGGGDPIECVTLYDFETTAPDSFSTFGAVDTTLYASEFTIPNPGPDAVNGSDNVMKYTKGADAAEWAGYFWGLNTPIDANNAFQVCLDYWSPTAGQILIKLENGNGAQDWELAAQNSTPGAWETLCVDLTADSQGANAGPATGRTFNRMVLFPEFQVAGTGSNVDYYIDNIIVKNDNTVRNYDVTFAVDMSEYADPYTTVYVSGSFNNWSGTANPLTDDGNGVWSTTVNIPRGEVEYKFTVDDWSAQESFGRFDECVKVSDDGAGGFFVNRSALVVSDASIGPNCWNACYGCGESYSVTWNVSFATVEVDPSGLFVAGGCCFGNSVHELTDEDGDGIYSLTIRRAAGFNSHYTFLNGACGDWSCKELIDGQDCADPLNFNDRFLEPLTGDVVINTCYGQCTDQAECVVVPEVEVTFSVDMAGEDISAEGVKIAGNFTNWSDEDMTNVSGTQYSYTTTLPANDYEYKFKNGSIGWEAFSEGDPCTITSDDGTGNIFINRLISLSGNNASESTPIFCFNTCNNCGVGVNDLNVDNTMLEVRPTLSSVYFDLTFNTTSESQLSIMSTQGELISTESIGLNVTNKRVDATTLAPGMYFINLVTDKAMATHRVVVTQ